MLFPFPLIGIDASRPWKSASLIFKEKLDAYQFFLS